MHHHLTDKGNFYKANAESPVQQERSDEENLLNMVENSLSGSVRKTIFN